MSERPGDHPVPRPVRPVDASLDWASRWPSWARSSATVALLTVYLTANLAWFLYQLSSWLDSHPDDSDAFYHVATTMWWQVVVNGLLLLTLRQTRKVGASLLLSALALIALMFMVGMWAMRAG